MALRSSVFIDKARREFQSRTQKSINNFSSIFISIPQSEYCNEFTVQKNCKDEWCSCTHKIDASLGDLVEIIVVDEGVTFNANHPMHIHGYKFRAVAMAKVWSFAGSISFLFSCYQLKLFQPSKLQS